MDLLAAVESLVLILLTSLNIQSLSGCPPGWTNYASQNMCLLYMTAMKNWTDAEASCVRSQGHLVSIKTTYESMAANHFRLSQEVQGDPVWIGAHSDAGRWQWRDGSSVTWATWESGTEPQASSGSECVVLKESSTDSSFVWSVYPCPMVLAFICQANTDMPLSSSSQVSRNWQRLEVEGEYSGKNTIKLVSQSLISCVVTCQSTSDCKAVTFNAKENICQLILQQFNTTQIKTLQNVEVWVPST